MNTAITYMPYQQLIQSNLCGIKQGRKGMCSNCHCHMQFHGQFHGTLCKYKYNFQIGRLDFKHLQHQKQVYLNWLQVTVAILTLAAMGDMVIIEPILLMSHHKR